MNNKKKSDFSLRTLSHRSDKISEHCKSILSENVFNDDSNNKNIAITGGYGVGKSTMIHSYIEECKLKDSTIFVSMGNINDDNLEEQSLETSIINRLVYAVESSTLKGSKFSFISVNETFKLLLFTLFSFVISLLYFLLPSNYTKLPNYIIKFLELPFVRFIFLAVFVTSIYFIIKFIIQWIHDGRINKIKVSSSEIELNKSESEKIKYLNYHLHDLLSILKKSEVKYYIFEDIDRFSNASILFSKMKEINSILNIKNDLNDIVKFIYVVKDDLFDKNVDRNKFFDLVIPVVPFVNNTNSRDYFLELLKCYGVECGDEVRMMISKISPFIYDARTITNIVNEFKVFQYHFDDYNLPKEIVKLLSIIIYKNYFLHDYTLVHSHTGLLNYLFSNDGIQSGVTIKKGDVSNKIAENDKEILLLSNEIESKLKVEETTRSDLIYAKYAKEKLEEINSDSYAHTRRILENFQLEEAEMLAALSEESKESLDQVIVTSEHDGINKSIQSLTKENIKLRNEVSDLQNHLYSKLSFNDFLEIVKNYYNNFSMNKSDRNVTIEELKLDEKYLILYILMNNMYIDTDYNKYISPFKEGFMTVYDNDYYTDIVTDRSVDNIFEKQVDNPSEIIDILDTKHFSSLNLLNKYMLKHIFSKRNNTNKAIKKLVIDNFSSDVNIRRVFELSLNGDPDFSIDFASWEEMFSINGDLIYNVFNFEDDTLLDVFNYFLDNNALESKENGVYKESLIECINEKLTADYSILNKLYDKLGESKFEQIIRIMNTKVEELSSIFVKKDFDRKLVKTLVKHNKVRINYSNVISILKDLRRLKQKSDEIEGYFFSVLLFYFDLNSGNYNSDRLIGVITACANSFKDEYDDEVYNTLRNELLKEDVVDMILLESLERTKNFTDNYPQVEVLLQCDFISDDIKGKYLDKIEKGSYTIENVAKTTNIESYLEISHKYLIEKNILEYMLYDFIIYMRDGKNDEYSFSDFEFDRSEFENSDTNEIIKTVIDRFNYSWEEFEEFKDDAISSILLNSDTDVKTFTSFDKVYRTNIEYDFVSLSLEKICAVLDNRRYEFDCEEFTTILSRDGLVVYDCVNSFGYYRDKVLECMCENYNDISDEGKIIVKELMLTDSSNDTEPISLKLVDKLINDGLIEKDEVVNLIEKCLNWSYDRDENYAYIRSILEFLGENAILNRVNYIGSQSSIKKTDNRKIILEFLKNNEYISNFIDSGENYIVTSNRHAYDSIED